VFRFFDLLRAQTVGIKIDRGALPTEVKRHSLIAANTLKRCGQDVLPRVLLHVIEPPVPIDAAAYRFAGGNFGKKVGNFVALIDDVEHGDSPQSAAIARLTARLRIERRAIQVYSRPACVDAGANHASGKFLEIAVGCSKGVWVFDIKPWRYLG